MILNRSEDIVALDVNKTELFMLAFVVPNPLRGANFGIQSVLMRRSGRKVVELTYADFTNTTAELTNFVSPEDKQRIDGHHRTETQLARAMTVEALKSTYEPTYDGTEVPKE